jgi:hypothetical protein
VTFLVRFPLLDALLHLRGSKLEKHLVGLLEDQRPIVAFVGTRRIPPTKITFEGLSRIILLDHAIRAGVHTLTATGTLSNVYDNDIPLIPKDGSLRTRFHAGSVGALKTDTRDRIALECEVADPDTRL